MADLGSLDGVQEPLEDSVAAAEAAPAAEAAAESAPQAEAAPHAEAVAIPEAATAAPEATEEQESEAATAAEPAPAAAPDASEAAAPAAAAAPEAADAGASSSQRRSSEARGEVDEDPVPAPESKPAAPSNAAKQGKQAKAKAAANSSSAKPSGPPAAAPAEDAAAPAAGVKLAPAAATPAPAAAAAAGDPEREVIKSTNEKEVPPKPTVKVAELRQTLSGSGAALTGGLALPPAPGPARERPPSPALSPHDAVNTTNVAALLQASEFRLKPGVDEVAYEVLMGLRLEDGIDVTRKEEYLSSDEFTRVMGVTKEAFAKLPAWKRLQKKRDVNLF